MALKDKYDVVVIGAGIGGLSCGAWLAKKGLSVLVVEQHSRPGGYCTSFQRKGFTFDAGFDTTLECDKDGIVYDTLDELGQAKNIHFIKLPSPMRIIGRDYDVRVTTVEALGKQLKRLSPGDSEEINSFLADCKALALEMKRLSEVPPDLLGMTGKFGLMTKFLLQSPQMRKYGGKSLGQALDMHFKDPRLKAIFGTVVPFGPKGMAPLLMMILGGEAVGYYPEGGAQALADAISRGLSLHGGELALNTRASKIIIKNGKAAGIKIANEGEIYSRFIISNADARETFLELVGQENLAQRFIKEIKDTPISESHFLVSLGVDMNLKTMGFDGTSIIYNRCGDLDNIFSTDLENCYLSIRMHSLHDSSQAPENMATVQLLTCLPCTYMGNWKREEKGHLGPEYHQLKQAVANRLIDSATQLIPGLASHILVKDIATPLTFERYTLNSGGASMGWFPTPGNGIRSQRTPIKNLYQAGAWTYPGASLYAVVQSGRAAAQLILKQSD